jgi:prevent-host-death family protein
MKVSIASAKRKLSELIKAVEQGKTVTICRNEVPVVDLVLAKPCIAERPKFGTLAGRVLVHDPDWWKPWG